MGFKFIACCWAVLLSFLSFSNAAEESRGQFESIFELQPVDPQSPDLKQLTEKLTQHKIIRAEFTQSKKIKVLKLPLISQGNMLYSELDGLYWKIKSPFLSELRLTKNSIAQREESGDWQVLSEGQSEAGKVSLVFLAFLTGDIEALSNNFILYFQKHEGHWLLGLEPKTELLKNIMAKVVISGDSLVREINSWEGNGDSTQILFTNATNNHAELAESESHVFAK